MGEVIRFPGRRVRPVERGYQGEVYVAPVEDDGGSWGIFVQQHGSDTADYVGNRFALDDALAAASQLEVDLGIDADHGGHAA